MAGEKVRLHIALPASTVNDIQLLMQKIGQGALAGFELGGISWQASQIAENVKDYDADALLLSPLIPGYNSSIIPMLYHNPEKPIVTIAVVPRENMEWASAMEEAGAVAHLTSPLTPEQIDRLAEIVPPAISKAWQERQSPKYVPRLSLPEAIVVDRYGWEKGTFAFWGPSGGQGKSTLAANTAAALSAIGGRHVLFIDADMNKADGHLYFDIPMGGNNIFALARKYWALQEAADGILPYNTLQSFLVEKRFKASSSPLFVLPGIPQAWMASDDALCGPEGRQGSAFTRALLQCATRSFDFVIVDLGQSVAHPVHWQALQEANIVFAICTTARTSINNLRKALEFLKDRMPMEKIRVVVNMFHPRHGVTPAQIQKALGYPVLLTIPVASDEEAVIALNEGVPLVLYNINNPASQAMLNLASTIYPPLSEILRRANWVKPQGFLARLLGG